MTIDDVVERWHRHLAGDLPGGLDELLADDVVFYSPVVYTPQRGKEITTLYLEAAKQALPGDAGEGAFHYTKQVTAGDTAVLEFETTVAGKYVNGVDILRCDDAGRIVEFRVMIRPLQAVNAVHQQMQEMLAALQS
ncbi:MAG TPA: nuclear transport factor 2 family protein [Mycobacteriales bacterium]|nr:nuclear transport factor 2 family protein [Mycobacteriales bacterium]